jgi:hypothetical protein
MNVPMTSIGSVLQNTSYLARSTELQPIVVLLVYFTVEQQQSNPISIEVDESHVLNTVILDSLETFETRPIPATKSSIEALEKVRLQLQP